MLLSRSISVNFEQIINFQTRTRHWGQQQGRLKAKLSLATSKITAAPIAPRS